MNITELSKLSDEEVRVRVAEALGWTYHGHSEELKMEALACWTPLGREFDPMSVIVLPDWSRDLNAAFTLVDKLKADGWSVHIYRYPRDEWRVDLKRYAQDDWPYFEHPSLCRAICITFLAVTERKEG